MEVIERGQILRDLRSTKFDQIFFFTIFILSGFVIRFENQGFAYFCDWMSLSRDIEIFLELLTILAVHPNIFGNYLIAKSSITLIPAGFDWVDVVVVLVERCKLRRFEKDGNCDLVAIAEAHSIYEIDLVCRKVLCCY